MSALDGGSPEGGAIGPSGRDEALAAAFRSHPRRWRGYRLVYPVISRRSKGLSIGVNLNRDGACNFDCVYCSAATPHPGAGPLDLPLLQRELRALIAAATRPTGPCSIRNLFTEQEFRDIPPEYHRLADVAFSGDGEPTGSPWFAPAARIVLHEMKRADLAGVPVVLITNGSFLHRPDVQRTLRFLDAGGLDVWAKLDAGTEEFFQKINRAATTLARVLDNLAAVGRERPITIQSLFAQVDGAPPRESELRAYVDRLTWLIEQGARIRRVQVYTVARTPAEAWVTPLPAEQLEAIAARVRARGIPAESFA